MQVEKQRIKEEEEGKDYEFTLTFHLPIRVIWPLGFVPGYIEIQNVTYRFHKIHPEDNPSLRLWKFEDKFYYTTRSFLDAVESIVRERWEIDKK